MATNESRNTNTRHAVILITVVNGGWYNNITPICIRDPYHYSFIPFEAVSNVINKNTHNRESIYARHAHQYSENKFQF